MNPNLPPDGFADESANSGPPDGFADNQPQQPQQPKSNGMLDMVSNAIGQTPLGMAAQGTNSAMQGMGKVFTPFIPAETIGKAVSPIFRGSRALGVGVAKNLGGQMMGVNPGQNVANSVNRAQAAYQPGYQPQGMAESIGSTIGENAPTVAAQTLSPGVGGPLTFMAQQAAETGKVSPVPLLSLAGEAYNRVPLFRKGLKGTGKALASGVEKTTGIPADSVESTFNKPTSLFTAPNQKEVSAAYNKSEFPEMTKSLDDILQEGTGSYAGQVKRGANAIKSYVEDSQYGNQSNEPVLYHGTSANFDAFDNSLKGSITGARSAKGAIWFTDKPEVARAYATYAAENGPINQIQTEIDAAEKIAQKSGSQSDWSKYDNLISKQEDLASYEKTFQRRSLANVKEARLRGDFYTVDAQGKTPQELSADGNIDSWLNSQLDKAKRMGKDGVIFKNLDDAVGLYNKPSDHYAIFDTKNIVPKSMFNNPQENTNPLARNILEGRKALDKQIALIQNQVDASKGPGRSALVSALNAKLELRKTFNLALDQMVPKLRAADALASQRLKVAPFRNLTLPGKINFLSPEGLLRSVPGLPTALGVGISGLGAAAKGVGGAIQATSPAISAQIGSRMMPDEATARKFWNQAKSEGLKGEEAKKRARELMNGSR
jgi:hypothetical protein